MIEVLYTIQIYKAIISVVVIVIDSICMVCYMCIKAYSVMSRPRTNKDLLPHGLLCLYW